MAMKLFIISVLSMISFLLQAEDLNAFRTKTGTIISCAPEKTEEAITIKDATRTLKRGNVLHLAPGKYGSSNYEIDPDFVIIEGELGKFASITLEIKGKKCIVRNLWIQRLESDCDITLIDCVIGNYENHSGEKIEQNFYNCCFNGVWLGYSEKNKYNFKRCTIVSPRSDTITIGDSSIAFTDCVLYSSEKLFCLSGEKSKISFSNSIVFGETALAANNNKNKKAFDMKEFKKLCKVSAKDDVITEKPIFLKEVNIDSFYESGPSLDMFILDEKSPGKDKKIGANMNETGFPVPEDNPKEGDKKNKPGKPDEKP